MHTPMMSAYSMMAPNMFGMPMNMLAQVRNMRRIMVLAIGE
jgi:hypothetical protein